MVVNHNRWKDGFGKGIVTPTGLGIHKRHLGMTSKINLSDRYQFNVEIAQHRSVLRPTNNSTQGSVLYFTDSVVRVT
jgi:hypothetical protein